MELMGIIFLLAEDKYEEAGIALEEFYQQHPTIDPGSYFLASYYANFGEYDKALQVKMQPFLKTPFDLVFAKSQNDISKLKEMKTQLAETNDERGKYIIDSELLLMEGEVERYINRLDSIFFVLGYHQPADLQCFPPPDSIRLHPKFQEMMKRRGFKVRPRATILN